MPSHYEQTSDFLTLPPTEQHKVLLELNADYKGLPPPEQQKVLGTIQDKSLNVATLFKQGQIPQESPEYTVAQRLYLNVKPFAKSAAEATALIGGGMTGAAAGVTGGPAAPVTVPIGAVAGAGLAYGGVQSFFNFLDTALGLRKPESLVSEFKESGKAIAEGAAMEAGGQVLGKAASMGVKVLPEAIKHPFRAIGDKAAITQRGARAKALERFETEVAGTIKTQPQITQNVRIAKELEAKIPGLKFSQGQLTNDASAISLERMLARKTGQDLSQTQREVANDVLRQFYATKAAGPGQVTDFTANVELMQANLTAATRKAEDAVSAEVTRLARTMDEQTVGKTVFERLSAKKQGLKSQATKLYNKIPNAPLPAQPLVQGVDDLIRAENKIIEPRTTQMIQLIKGQIGKKAEATIGYQNLRQIRSRIGKARSAAGSGLNPNLEDARQLGILQEQIEKTMAQVENVNPEIGRAYREANSFYRETYIPRVRQGTVADVLQPGPRGEPSRIALANIAKEFNSLDGIDDFIRVVGNDKAAKQAMHDYYAYDLLNSARDPATGKLVTQKAMNWHFRNAAKLKKLGLDGELKTVVGMQKAADAAAKNLDVFNKSVAGRILESDTDTFVGNAFSGSKNYGTTASKLMAMVRGNQAAEAGLKKAVADHLHRQSKTTAASFFQMGGETIADIEFTLSVAKLTNQIRKFQPALTVIYKNEPEKLAAINDVLRAYQTLARTAKSPVGGGSDTFELFGKTMDIIAGATAPGKWYAFKTVRDMVNRFGERNVELYLRRAMFDPDYAIALQAATKGITPKRTDNIDQLMTLIIYQSGALEDNVGAQEISENNNGESAGASP